MFFRANRAFLLVPVLLQSAVLAIAQSPTPILADSTFQDVPQSGSSVSSFYTFIQLAKRVGLAVPAAVGPCATSTVGNPPVLPPPGSGTTPISVVCPFFGPDAVVSRAEMAYWIVK